jgi:hypothetical protein
MEMVVVFIAEFFLPQDTALPAGDARYEVWQQA